MCWLVCACIQSVPPSPPAPAAPSGIVTFTSSRHNHNGCYDKYPNDHQDKVALPSPQRTEVSAIHCVRMHAVSPTMRSSWENSLQSPPHFSDTQDTQPDTTQGNSVRDQAWRGFSQQSAHDAAVKGSLPVPKFAPMAVNVMPAVAGEVIGSKAVIVGLSYDNVGLCVHITARTEQVDTREGSLALRVFSQ